MQIRAAIAADAAEIARVHVACWQSAYRGQIPDAILDALDVQKRTVRWLEILAEPNGVVFAIESQNRIAGFCNLISSRDPEANPDTGEIAAIYIDPAHWRRGFGRALCQRLFHEAKQRHFAAITLWVLQTNLPAIKFYHRMGFIADGATKVERIKDFPLQETRLAFRL